jgi:hypothetical protein
MMESPKPTVVAFHLPQFHPTRINDANWGPGFSEWTNVVKAQPLFPGHQQPKLPGMLSFYDLRCPEALQEQAEVARLARVDAFCFYYYRFGAQRALERPLNNMLAYPEIDIDFLYCWANEPWTRAWDGRSDEVLLAQTYGNETAGALIEDLSRAMADPRYLRVDGRPVFMVYQIELLPHPAEFVASIVNGVTRRLGVAPMMGAVFSPGFKNDMLAYLDFVVQGPVRNFVCGRRFSFQACMAFAKRSPKMTANCALAIAHSRGGIFHSFSARFKTRKSSFIAASSVGKCPRARTARRSLALSASMAFVV